MILGFIVTATSLCAIAVRFSTRHKMDEQVLLDEAIARRRATSLESGSVVAA